MPQTRPTTSKRTLTQAFHESSLRPMNQGSAGDPRIYLLGLYLPNPIDHGCLISDPRCRPKRTRHAMDVCRQEEKNAWKKLPGSEDFVHEATYIQSSYIYPPHHPFYTDLLCTKVYARIEKRKNPQTSSIPFPPIPPATCRIS